MRAYRRWVGPVLAVLFGLGLVVAIWAYSSGWLFLIGLFAEGELEVGARSPAAVHVFVERGLVFVPARLGDRPVHLLLDSGLQFSVLNADRASELGFEISGWRSIPSGSGPVRLGFAPRLPIEIDGARFEPRRLPAMRLGFLEPYLGHRLDGILGHDFLSLAVVEIDYEREILRLHDSTGYSPPEDAATIPIEITGREVFASAELDPLVGEPVRARLKIDTGSVSGLGLEGSFVVRHELVESGQPTVPVPGVGLGGPTDSQAFRLERLSIGPFGLTRPFAFSTAASSREDEGAGTLGGEVLRRFTVTFDYTRRRIILQPGPRLGDPFPFNSSGLTLLAVGEDLQNLKVRDVVPGSPADWAGIREGDEIVSLKGRPARDLTLGDAESLLSREGVLIEARVRRDGEVRKMSVETRTLLP